MKKIMFLLVAIFLLFSIGYATVESHLSKQDKGKQTSVDGRNIKSIVSSKPTKSTPLMGAFFDNVEWQEDFAVINLVGWQSLNRNGLNDANMPYQDFPGKGEKNGFIAYNVTQTNPPNTIESFEPLSGNKYYLVVPSEDGNVDDWLITNELAPHQGGTFSFYSKFAFDFFGDEEFKVGYSITNMESSSFTFFSKVIPQGNWTKYSYDIPANAKYIAINYFGAGYCLMVDDIEWSPSIAGNSPNCITNLLVDYQLNPTMKATVTWTNPSSTNADGSLTELSGVKIYRGNHPMNYELIATITDGITIGGAGQYVDNASESGYYSYRVIPYNTEGEATAVSSPLQYFGPETTPGAPRNIVFSRNDQNQTVISWDLVNYGALGGELKDVVTAYIVTRTLGENTVTLGTVTTPTITETDSPELNFYTYSVTAIVTEDNVSAATIIPMYSGMSEDQYPVTLGIKESEQPFSIKQSSILTQSIYNAEEIGETGVINGITYFTNFKDGGAGKIRYKIYMSQTDREVFGESQTTLKWEYYGNQKLVFDGELELNANRNAIDIVLDQPFFFNDGENLIVTIVKPITTANSSLWSAYSFNTPTLTFRTYYAIGYTTDMSVATTQPPSWQTGEVLSVPSIAISKSKNYSALSGKVTLADGTAVENAMIDIRPADENSYQCEVTTTNENGEYNIDALLAGNYKMIVSSVGYTAKEVLFTITGTEAKVQDVTLDQKMGIVLTGKVINEQQVGIANAYINLSGYSVANAKTAADGTFTIDVYTECEYKVEVTHPLYNDASVEISTALEDYNMNDISLSINPIKPSNLIAKAEGNIVNMTWDKPVGLDNEKMLAWGSLTSTGNGWGAGGTEFTSAVYFDTADLNSLLLDGAYLTHVKSFINNNSTIYIEIYEGKMAQTLIYTQKEIIETRGMYTFELDKHISIDKSKDLWIAIRFPVGYGAYPIGIDEGPNNPKGSMCKEDNKWAQMSLTNKNWIIYGITNTTVDAAVSEYKIYRSTFESPNAWTELATAATSSFSDSSLNATDYGVFNYGVAAKYGDMLSDKTVKQVNVNMNFNVTVKMEPNVGTAKGAFVRLSNDEFINERFCSENDTVVFQNVVRGDYNLQIIKENYDIANSNIAIAKSESITVKLNEVICNPIDLMGEVSNGNQAKISWNLTNMYEESFENYKDFEKTNISNYILRDLDNTPTYTYTNFTFPGAGDKMAFMVFNQKATIPAVVMPSYSGSRHLVAMASEGTKNNDWLIMPTSSGKLSFKASSLLGSSPEQMIVWYSKKGSANADFVKLSSGSYVTVPAEWTNYEYTLPEGTKYVAINYVTNDSYMLLIDDINFPKAYNHALSYNIYLNGELNNNVNTQTGELTIPNGMNTIEVEAVFESGKSGKAMIQLLGNVSINEAENALSLSIYPNPIKDMLNIEGAFTSLTIYSVDGRLLMSFDNTTANNVGNITQINVSSLQKGTYLIKVYNESKVATYKIVK